MLTVDVEGGGSGIVEVSDSIMAMLEGCEHFKGAATSVGELGDCVGRGSALDLDGVHDNVSNFEGAERAARVSSVGRFEAPVFGQVPEDLDGEEGLALAEAEELVEVVDLDFVWRGDGDGLKVAVDGEAEWATNGWDTADDIGAVNG